MAPFESKNQNIPGECTIIGTGKLGSALALQLYRKGYVIRSLYNRSLPACEKLAGVTQVRITGTFPQSGDDLGGLVFLSLPDDQIGGFARTICEEIPEPDRFGWIHTSGGTPTGALQPLMDAGAAVASFHPVQTFSGKNNGTAFERTYVTLNGNEKLCKVLEKLVLDLGGRPLQVNDQQKMAIHLAAVFVCNYYAPLFAASRQVLADNEITAGADDLFGPIVRQTVEGLLQHRPADVLTGPIVRGDTGTIAQHLKILEKTPQWKRLYCDMGLAALQLAGDIAGRDGSEDDRLKQCFK